MEVIVIVMTLLVLLVAIVAPIIWISSIKKSDETAGGPSINPLAGGPRYRDGMMTYNQSDGRRYNIAIEDPRHGSRYNRRHFYRERKPKKPWEK